LPPARLDADPHEPRPRNLMRPDEMPFAAGIRYRDGEPLVLDGGDYPQALRRAAERVDYAGIDLPCANKHCRQVSPPGAVLGQCRRVGCLPAGEQFWHPLPLTE
jgi:hypothetical protein